MTELTPIWQTDDILRLAPNTTTATDGQRYARPDYWQGLGTDGVHIWGKFQGAKPLQTAVDLASVVTGVQRRHCECHHTACEHMIALLLLFNATPSLFVSAHTSSYVRDHIGPHRLLAQPETDVMPDIRTGLARLDLWLKNMIRQGLAEPHIRDFDFWDEMADRMLAAWMPGLSQWLRETANIAVRGGDWVEPLLDELGRMYLLVRSFERFDQLSPEVRGDLRETIGWRFTLREMQGETPVRDQWHVIGQRQRVLGHDIPEQITWLSGSQSGRMALLHSLGSREVLQTAALRVGSVIEADLVYLPSRAPLKALLVNQYSSLPYTEMRGGSIGEAVEGFGSALAGNPWAKYYPVLLENVYVSRFGKGWTLRHADGTYLPIAPYFQHKWVLHALHGGQLHQVAALWDGRVLFPMSVNHASGVINLYQTMPYLRRADISLAQKNAI